MCARQAVSFDALVDDLSSAKKKIRLRAAEGLTGSGHHTAIVPLFGLVTSDPDVVVRRAAAVALIGAPRSAAQRDALIALMQDPNTDKRLRRDITLALTVPPDPVATEAIDSIIKDALVAETPFGIGPTLDVAPTTRLWWGPRRNALDAAIGGDSILFAVNLSDTLACVALEQRWVVLTDPKNRYTGLQDPNGRAIKVFTVPYVDSLPLARLGGTSGWVSFLRDSATLRFSGFDVTKQSLEQAEPFFAWLDRTHDPVVRPS